MHRCNKSPFELQRFFEANPDPLNIKEKGLQVFTREEVALHNKEPEIWTIYKNKVYDITLYIDYHQGGKDVLKTIYGKDCTEAFTKFHGYLNIDNFIKPLQIGVIKK